MSKFRKDGARDERYKGAKEINQTGFFGIILGLLFSSWGNKGLQEKGAKMAKNRQEFERNLKARLKSDPEFAKNYAEALEAREKKT